MTFASIFARLPAQIERLLSPADCRGGPHDRAVTSCLTSLTSSAGPACHAAVALIAEILLKTDIPTTYRGAYFRANASLRVAGLAGRIEQDWRASAVPRPRPETATRPETAPAPEIATSSR